MYHINSGSPYYQLYPEGNNARRTYYGINATPSSMCDGLLDVYPTTSNLMNAFNSRTNLDAPVDIDLTITVDDQIHVQADITAESYFASSATNLRVALIAMELPLSGFTYEYVLLDLAPSPTGQPFSIFPSTTETLYADFGVPTVTTLENIAVVAWVQDEITKEVHQSCHMAIPLNFPSISLSDYDVTDEAPGGNDNGFPEPGETCEAWIEVSNNPIFAMARDVTATLSTSDPLINITNATANLGDIPAGFSTSNIGSPFEFEIDGSLEAHFVTFQADIEANSGAYETTVYFDYMIGIPQFLLVDDDGGSNCEANYLTAFEELDYVVNTWDVLTEGSPSGDDLAFYEMVVWETGQALYPLSTNEQTAVMSYLDGGGKLFISSENLGDDLGGTAFYADYMHATHVSDYVMGFILNGVQGDPITDDANIILVGGAYTPDSQSGIEPDAEAYGILYYETTGQECGAIRYYGDDYALVYAAFPLECASNVAAGYTHRDELFEDILNWLDTPTSVFPNNETAGKLPNSFEIASISPNPFNPQTTINLDVPIQGEVELAVYNLLGERVALLHSGMMNAGSHRITFDGSSMASGVYMLKADTPEGVITEKMILMK